MLLPKASPLDLCVVFVRGQAFQYEYSRSFKQAFKDLYTKNKDSLILIFLHSIVFKYLAYKITYNYISVHILDLLKFMGHFYNTGRH